jgi:hypothetical protein
MMNGYLIWLHRDGRTMIEVAWADSPERGRQLAAECHPGWRVFAQKDVTAEVPDPL